MTHTAITMISIAFSMTLTTVTATNRAIAMSHIAVTDQYSYHYDQTATTSIAATMNQTAVTMGHIAVTMTRSAVVMIPRFLQLSP